MKKILIAVFAVAAGLSAAGAQEGGVNFEGMAVPMPKLERVQPAIPGRTVTMGETPGKAGVKGSGSLLAGFARGSGKPKSRSAKSDCFADCDYGYASCNDAAGIQADACTAECSSIECDVDDYACQNRASACFGSCNAMYASLMNFCSNTMAACTASCDKLSDEDKSAAGKTLKKTAGPGRK